MQEFIQTFFSNLGIEIKSIEVINQDSDFQINIETPDSALIIGLHGKNLESFQHLLGRMIEKRIGKFTRVHLEVNDYIKSKDERLYRMLESKIAFVLSTGKSSPVQNLTSYDRKKAHDYISNKDIKGLSTKSEGDGEKRMLVIHYNGEPVGVPEKKIETTLKNQINDLSEDGVGI